MNISLDNTETRQGQIRLNESPLTWAKRTILRVSILVFLLSASYSGCSYYPIGAIDGGSTDGDGGLSSDLNCIPIEWRKPEGVRMTCSTGYPRWPIDCAEGHGSLPRHAWVVRDIDCYESGGGFDQLTEIPNFDDEELVVLCDTYGGCYSDVRAVSVVDCGDFIGVEYIVTEPCEMCTAYYPCCAYILIPNDPRPIKESSKLERETCF